MKQFLVLEELGVRSWEFGAAIASTNAPLPPMEMGELIERKNWVDIQYQPNHYHQFKSTIDST